MKIVERQVGDVVILDLHGKILIGEGDDALREAVTKLADSGKTKVLLTITKLLTVFETYEAEGEAVNSFK
jgi:hypothetical protein